jgi:hypothetical protein
VVSVPQACQASRQGRQLVRSCRLVSELVPLLQLLPQMFLLLPLPHLPPQLVPELVSELVPELVPALVLVLWLLIVQQALLPCHLVRSCHLRRASSS